MWRGTARLGGAGVARIGPARHGRRGEARFGGVRQGEAGVARPGLARQGRARRGSARRGSAGAVRQGEVGRGKAGMEQEYKMIYQFRKGSRVSGVKAQAVGETLEQIRERDGILETEAVLKEARKKRSPIHAAFEWDDAAAGHEYRLIQARQMIRAVIVILDDTDEPAYVHVDDGMSRYYQSTSIAANNTDEWSIIRQMALRSLQGAVDNLDRLDAIAKRIEHESRGTVIRSRDAVSEAAKRLSAT